MKWLILCLAVISAACQKPMNTAIANESTLIEVDEEIPNNGVLYVRVPGESEGLILGHYVIDTRFNLCFFVIPGAIERVNCKLLKINSNE